MKKLMSIVLAVSTVTTSLVSAAESKPKMQKVISYMPQAPFGQSGGDPIEIRTAPYNQNIIYQSTSQDAVLLNNIPRLGLRANQVIKRVEVRAAGQGSIVVSLNNQRVSNEIQINEKFDFQTYTLKVDRAIPLQDPLQVKIEVVSGEVRFMDFSVLMLKSNTNTSTSSTSILSNKKTCEVNPAIMSHGWTLQIGSADDAYFASPSKLFNSINQNCKAMKFLCYVSESDNGKFEVSVNIRGEIHSKTGSLSLEDATKELSKLQASGFCAY